MSFLLLLSILLILGLFSTRIMKILKLPNVTGYLIIGLIAAVICITYDHFNGNTELTDELNSLNGFVSSATLGFIALSIGEEFKVSKMKEFGGKILLITFLQAMTACVFVDAVLILVCYLFGLPLEIGIALGSVAIATAPAATVMVIQQYKAKGPLVDILLPVVAFDDAIGLVVFSISMTICSCISQPDFVPTVYNVFLVPVIEIFGSLIIGFALGFFLNQTLKLFKSRHNHVTTLIAFTLLGVGICQLLSNLVLDGNKLEFSSLLCCMMIGATYINFGKNKEIVERDFTLLDAWTPTLFMLFFVLSGTHLATSFTGLLNKNVNMLYVGVIFACYLVFRSLGKYLGAFIGCKITKRSKQITHYLGLTLLPQAGVAIGMANQISSMEMFQSTGVGDIIVTVILFATLIYELVGPLLTKFALKKSGEIPEETA